VNDVVMVGASHDVAPLRAVEVLAVRPGQHATVLDRLMEAGCVEAVVLSTCSRTEIYAVLPHRRWADVLLDVLLAPAGPDASLRERMARRAGPEVEAHLFRVAAGLDSRVAGEVEIQGQVRSAARAAEEHGTMGPRLRALFGAAVATARRAHRETALAELGRSAGRIAVDAALEGIGTEQPQVAVIGTGRMARVAVERLAELDVAPVVYGRSLERAKDLTDRTTPVRGIDEIHVALEHADIVLCATSASSYLVTVADVRRAMSRRTTRRLVVVDLSVPRNVDPCASATPGLRLIDLEELRDVRAAPEHAELDAALGQARAIVADGLRRLHAVRRSGVTGPVIAQLHVSAEAAYRRSLRLLRPELVTNGTLDDVARTLSRRHVHRSIIEVREAAERNDFEAIDQIVRNIGEHSLPPAIPIPLV
jgi:glutamyl-tRNA reductase